MSVAVEEPDADLSGPAMTLARGRAEPSDFPPRPAQASWPATRQAHDEVRQRLTCPPFVLPIADNQNKRVLGVALLLEWWADQPGMTWQDRWLASGADAAGATWRQLPARWCHERGHGPWRREALVEALPVAISADLVRPSLAWLVGGGPARGGLLVRTLAATRDREGFARLRALCEADSGVSAPIASQTAYRSALILAAKGGQLTQITVGDVVELFAAEAQVRVNPGSGRTTFYRILRQLGASARRRRRCCGGCAPPVNAARRS